VADYIGQLSGQLFDIGYALFSFWFDLTRPGPRSASSLRTAQFPESEWNSAYVHFPMKVQVLGIVSVKRPAQMQQVPKTFTDARVFGMLLLITCRDHLRRFLISLHYSYNVLIPCSHCFTDISWWWWGWYVFVCSVSVQRSQSLHCKHFALCKLRTHDHW